MLPKVPTPKDERSIIASSKANPPNATAVAMSYFWAKKNWAAWGCFGVLGSFGVLGAGGVIVGGDAVVVGGVATGGIAVGGVGG